jgi:hypothetical protein
VTHPLDRPGAIVRRFAFHPESHDTLTVLAELVAELERTPPPPAATHFLRHLLLDPKVDRQGRTRGRRYDVRLIWWPWPTRAEAHNREKESR